MIEIILGIIFAPIVALAAIRMAWDMTGINGRRRRRGGRRRRR